MTAWPPAPARRRVRAPRQLPEPGRFWIAARPRLWTCTEGPWTDLATGRLAAFRGRAEPLFPEIEVGRLDDLFYLPPADEPLAVDRDRLVAELAQAGTPVLVELRPGETPPGGEAAAVYDLSAPLLAGDVGRLSEVPADSVAVWPLIAGLTDRPDAWDEGLALLAEAGARCVQPVAVELEAVVRRCLAEERQDGELFDVLFHGQAPSEREFSRAAHRFGLAAFMPRPQTGATGRQRRNRRIAAALALAGELWLRLGRSQSDGQALLRAARGADRTSYDLAALVRDRNLALMPWLDRAGVEVVSESVTQGSASLVESLLEEYLD